jgi:hypothetical protein
MPPELATPASPVSTVLSWPTPEEWAGQAIQIALAFVYGCLAALIYALTMRTGRRSARPFLATLVLLSVLISLVTVVIGTNVARAFGLVGALSIVRFRTVVQDTRDTAFVILAVIVGMAAGSGNITGPLLCMPVVLLTTWLFRPRRAQREQHEAQVVLRMSATHTPGDAVRKALEAHTGGYRQTGVATARGGAALEVTYLVYLRSPEAPMALVMELSRVEGVQNVELKEQR